MTLPLGNWPLVKTGVMLSNSLIFLASIARMLPEGTSFFRLKIFGVENVERIRLRDDALRHVVGGRDDVLNGDAGLFLDLLRHVVGLVHRGAEIAQHLVVGRPDGREAGDRAGAGGRARNARGALEDRCGGRDRPLPSHASLTSVTPPPSPKASQRRGKRVNVLVRPQNRNLISDVQGLAAELLVADQSGEFGMVGDVRATT